MNERHYYYYYNKEKRMYILIYPLYSWQQES